MVTTRSLRGHYAVTTRSLRGHYGHYAVTTRSLRSRGHYAIKKSYTFEAKTLNFAQKRPLNTTQKQRFLKAKTAQLRSKT